jgi:type II secretory pathway pseudopilin PulG
MAGRRQAGFTLIEATLASFVITVGVLALLGVFPGVLNLVRQSRETQVALSAARSRLDLMRTAPWPDPMNPTNPNLLNMYNGTTFTVLGLALPSTGNEGSVTFLTEAQASAAYGGIPLDLNLNQITNETATADATWVCYPVAVTITWNDEQGLPRTVTMTSILYNNNQ